MGALHRLTRVVGVVQRRRRLIEGEDDVRPERFLNGDRRLGGQPLPRAVDVRGEGCAVFVHAHQLRTLATRRYRRVAREHADLLAHPVFQTEPEREHLEAAAVGDDGPVPTHEAVQAAQLVDRLRARAEKQVVRVRQQDARA